MIGTTVGIKCEKSRHQRKDAKRCEKSGKDAKRAVLWKKKNRLCYIELGFDCMTLLKINVSEFQIFL